MSPLGWWREHLPFQSLSPQAPSHHFISVFPTRTRTSLGADRPGAVPYPPVPNSNLPMFLRLQYLLAMVLVYFRRANLKLSEYTRSNLFLAL